MALGIRRKPATGTVDDMLAAVDPAHLDESSPLYVDADPDVRREFLALALDRREVRKAEDTVRDLGWPTVDVDEVGRTVTVAAPSVEARVHAVLLDSARGRVQRARARAHVDEVRRDAAEAATRCGLCGAHGLDDDKPTAHYLVSASLGAVEPRYGVAGAAMRLHADCAAALDEAARRRLEPALVDRAEEFLARL